MEDASSAQAKERSYKDVTLISIGHAFTHWYPATFIILIPLIGTELGLSYTQIGFILTFKSIVSSMAGVPGGMLVDIVKRKALLMAISLFWVGFPYLIMGFTHSYIAILLCMALVGVGNTLWHPTAIPTLSQLYPKRKGFVLSLHGMGSNLGDALAPLAIGFLLLYWDWRDVVLVNVVPGFAMAAVILFMLRHLYAAETAKRKKETENQKGFQIREYMSGLKDLFKNRSLILLSTSSAFRSMTQGSLYIFLPLFLMHELGYTAFLLGVCMFLLQAAGFIAAPIAGYLSDKVGRKKIIMSSMAMTAAVLLLMAILPKTLFVIFIAILGFFLYAIRPVIQAWLMDTTSDKVAGASISVLFGVQSLGSSAAPLLLGVIADAYGLFAGIYFIAATIIIANFLVFFMPRTEEAKPPALSA